MSKMGGGVVGVGEATGKGVDAPAAREDKGFLIDGGGATVDMALVIVIRDRLYVKRRADNMTARLRGRVRKRIN